MSGKWDVKQEQNTLTIYIPKFHELLDNWQIRKVDKRRSNDVATTEKLPLELEVELEVDKEKETKAKFVPPDLSEVTVYCQQRKNNVDPQTWVDFYTAKGWMIGKNKMKDWKAAVRTWEKSSHSETTHSNPIDRLKREMNLDNGTDS